MRTDTYCRLENLYAKYRGYISTKELLGEGFSNRQIAALTEENYLEKVCYGYYWLLRCGHGKPADYKCIEVCLSNPGAVISMESACYYQGIIETEPEYLVVATERTDRSRMKMNFPVERHYFSHSNFRMGLRKVQTESGSYNMYDAERCVCDMMRLNHEIADGVSVAEIIDYMKAIKGRYERMLTYAKIFGIVPK